MRRRVESIYSKQSEKSKACQRKPTALLTLSSTERFHKKPFACLPTALRPSGPVQQWIFHQAEQELTTLPGLRYSSGHRKGRLKILSIRPRPALWEFAPFIRATSDRLIDSAEVENALTLNSTWMQRPIVYAWTRQSALPEMSLVHRRDRFLQALKVGRQRISSKTEFDRFCLKVTTCYKRLK